MLNLYNVNIDNSFVDIVSKIALKAGELIKIEFKKKKIDISYKSDGSPVTYADIKANAIIVESLKKFNSKIPILSEESPIDSKIINSELFWAVDPLDGSKEFISNSSDFTVNIGLVYKNYPIFGVIYAPMSDFLWFGFDDRKKNGCKRAKKLCKASYQIFLEKQNWKEIHVKKSKKTFIVTSSKRHKSNQKLNEWIELNKVNRKVEMVERGSSLKICLVAEGSAHFYPRFGRTCVWDTAAGHAIVNAAGGSIISFLTKKELKYEESIYNSDFIVSNALF